MLTINNLYLLFEDHGVGEVEHFLLTSTCYGLKTLRARLSPMAKSSPLGSECKKKWEYYQLRCLKNIGITGKIV